MKILSIDPDHTTEPSQLILNVEPALEHDVLARAGALAHREGFQVRLLRFHTGQLCLEHPQSLPIDKEAIAKAEALLSAAEIEVAAEQTRQRELRKAWLEGLSSAVGLPTAAPRGAVTS